MAHAFFERAGGEARSAGTRPSDRLHPNVVEAMGELGIDLSSRVPRKLERPDAEWADLVITMGCGDECPVIPGKEYRDWPIEDPVGKSLEETRPIRDEIADRVSRLVADSVFEPSGHRAKGFAERYDSYRPRPPSALLDLLCRLAGVERPRLVVDLGSGTGLSTEVWADRADAVVGIEPSPDMRMVAASRAPSNVRYLDAEATSIGLPDASADVVTASQSLHWMEPEPTFAEVARILRPGGVFAAYDYDWPPTIHPEVDAALEECVRRSAFWGPAEKERHLERMRSSGRFRYPKEVLLHGEEEGGAERVVGLASTAGPVARRLAEGATEEELGLTELRAAAERVLGGRAVPWLVSYRVRLGFK